MTSLLYRGHAYTKTNASISQDVVQLTYRRQVYQQRQNTTPKTTVHLIYRGVGYTR